MQKESGTTGTPDELALKAIGAGMGFGVAVIAVFSLGTDSARSFFATASTGMLVAAASTLVGCLLGFLFGIPRTLQSSADQSAPDPASRSQGGVRYQANTNLEQISDWLTKILVGVGLTQLTSLDERLAALAAFIAPALGSAPSPEVLSISIVTYFSVSGFLFGYLWTRLYLAQALRRADVTSIGERVRELEKQSEKDARALELVQHHLNSASGSRDVSDESLVNAIMDASSSARQTIFNQAWEVRTRNWREEKTKPVMTLTIPVFRALIRADVSNQYHRNHGQLGYALKDQPQPEWEMAEAELTKAIEVRGDWRENGFLFYEFNRAICRIMLDPARGTDSPSSPEVLSRVMADLHDAAHAEQILDIITGDADIRDWLERNGESVEEL